MEKNLKKQQRRAHDLAKRASTLRAAKKAEIIRAEEIIRKRSQLAKDKAQNEKNLTSARKIIGLWKLHQAALKQKLQKADRQKKVELVRHLKAVKVE